MMEDAPLVLRGSAGEFRQRGVDIQRQFAVEKGLDLAAAVIEDAIDAEVELGQIELENVVLEQAYEFIVRRGVLWVFPRLLRENPQHLAKPSGLSVSAVPTTTTVQDTHRALVSRIAGRVPPLDVAWFVFVL